MPAPTTPTRYRVTTAVVEALQWTGSNDDAMSAFIGDRFDVGNLYSNPDDRASVREDPSEARVLLPISHWVVRGYNGNVFVVDDPSFTANYAPEIAPVVGFPAKVTDLLDREGDIWSKGRDQHWFLLRAGHTQREIGASLADLAEQYGPLTPIRWATSAGDGFREVPQDAEANP